MIFSQMDFPQSSQSSTILVVDDNPINLRVLSATLENSGFTVAVATDGKSCLTQAEYLQPDLILLDVMMPEMDGFETCKRLLSGPITQNIPVIFMTALTEPHEKLKGFASGAMDYITKPFQKEEVIARVNLQLKLRSLTNCLKQNNQRLIQEVAARKAVEADLQQLNQQLEQRVVDRTQQLAQALQEVKLREESLVYAAFHDSLTGVFNRTWLLKHLSDLLDRQQVDAQTSYTVFFIDLDRFKRVNDHLGHLIGDHLLCLVADRLRSYLPPGGHIARLGGDEFLILLPQVDDITWLESLANQMIAGLQVPFKILNYQLAIGASIGILPSTAVYQQSSDILRDADAAMYQAKRFSRGCAMVFTAERQAKFLDRLQLEEDLLRGLEQQEFMVYYQPIFSLTQQRPVGFEALTRWHHPTRGLISPATFIPIAEETGLIHQLDLWVTQVACAQMSRWLRLLESKASLVVNVNFSVAQLQTMEIADQLAQILQTYNLLPASLKLEVTESAFMEKTSLTARALDRIHALGIKLCIDDFGTGYSSMSRLHTFPVNTLKIDYAFTSRLGVSSETNRVVKTIIDLAHGLGLTVVSEGIETSTQLEILQDLGCEFGQGFLLAKPLSSDQATHFLCNHFLANPHCPTTHA